MNDQMISELLAGSKPLSYRRLGDGGLIVINAKGQKLMFSRQQVKAAEAKLVKTSEVPIKSRSMKSKE